MGRFFVVVFSTMNPEKLSQRLGICQWFHFNDFYNVERSVKLLHDLGIHHLRTGISWADYHRPGGRQWYDWLFSALQPFELLVSVWHTPPSLSEGNSCSSPPRRLLDYADFIDSVITAHGKSWTALELWNEPNNFYKWDFARYDPGWEKFASMVGSAAYWARQRHVRTVLGGMMPVDPEWLALMKRRGVTDQTDVVGIHGFPGMWWPHLPNWEWYSHWSGWHDKIDQIRSVAGKLPVWVTETGFATWDHEKSVPGRHQEQVYYLKEATEVPVSRLYWYCLLDLDPSREAIEGFHVDENEYHLGLVTHEGVLKPAYHILRKLLRKNGHPSEALQASSSPTETSGSRVTSKGDTC